MGQEGRATSGRGTSQPERLLEVLAAVELCRDKSFDELNTLVLRQAAGSMRPAILAMMFE